MVLSHTIGDEVLCSGSRLSGEWETSGVILNIISGVILNILLLQRHNLVIFTLRCTPAMHACLSPYFAAPQSLSVCLG